MVDLPALVREIQQIHTTRLYMGQHLFLSSLSFPIVKHGHLNQLASYGMAVAITTRRQTPQVHKPSLSCKASCHRLAMPLKQRCIHLMK